MCKLWPFESGSLAAAVTVANLLMSCLLDSGCMPLVCFQANRCAVLLAGFTQKWLSNAAFGSVGPSCAAVKVVLKGNGSKGLRPQLVRCAPFPSIALYFRML